MSLPSGNWRNNAVAFAVLVLAALMLVTAGQWGVLETSEARYAEISREMLRSGDWLHPRLMNIYHYHKPPVTYWLTALSYSIFGVNAFAVRFFLTIAFCIQVLLVYRITLHLFDDEVTARRSALMYATLPIVLISVRGLTTDAYLTTFVLLAVYSWIRFLKSGKAGFLYAMALALAFGFLTKGPVVLVVPLLAMVGLRRWLPKAHATAGQVVLSVLIFVLPGFSWFVLLTMENRAFADYFFFRHVVDRVAHAEVFARAEPWYYYLPLLPVIYLPWIAVIIGIHRKEIPAARQLIIWWFLAPLVLFSLFKSKLVLYILPLSLGFSVIAARILSHSGSTAFVRAFCGLILLVYLGLLAVPLIVDQYTITVALMAIPVLAIVISFGTLFYKAARELLTTVWSFLFASTLILYSAFFFERNGVQVNAIRPVATFIREHGLRERNILVCNEVLPSLAFELDKDVISVYAGRGSLRRETQFERNDRWKEFLFDATEEAGRKRIRSALAGEAVLVARNPMPPTIRELMVGQWREKRFGKWTLYYN